jgi:hypothetical protein
VSDWSIVASGAPPSPVFASGAAVMSVMPMMPSQPETLEARATDAATAAHNTAILYARSMRVLH